MAETPGTAAVQDDSPSLAGFIGDLHGDFLAAEPDSDASAPLAANPDSQPSEGTDPSAPAGAPPAPADATTEVPDPNAPSPESDPLEGSAPLSYTVNGEARSFEGITKLKDGGAIVDPEAVALLERRLGERDHLFERSQEQFRQIEELGELTKWRVRDANGQEQVLTGREGVQAQRLALGNYVAEVAELRAALNNPNLLASLILTEPDGQGGLRIVGIDQEALKGVHQRVSLAQREAALQVRAAMSRYGATPAPAANAQTFDPASAAPKALEVAIAHAAVTGLTAEDRKFLEGQAPLYIRQATQADVQQSAGAFKIGEPIVDPRFVEVVKDRAALRASTAATVSTASDVARRNAANLAAANTGKKPTPRATVPEPRAPTEAKHREEEEDAAFDRMMGTSAALLRQTR